MAQALVPLKDLVQAKSRLAGLLRPSERRALAQAMAEDVLSVLSDHPDIAQITLVSDDPGAGMLANKYGAQCWSERALGCNGLNPLIQRASERLLGEGEGPLLVLHADLPLLTVQDITTVLDCQRELAGLIVGCDHHGSGTNLLAFDVASMPRFSFGADSCAQHMASVRGAGMPCSILQRPGIAVDVDEPRDLKFVMEQLQLHAPGSTAQLLCSSALGTRLELALASLASDGPAVDQANTGMAN